MQPGIARRLIAAPADSLRNAAASAAVDRNSRPHGIAVRLGALQAERDEVARPFRLIVQVNEWFVLIEHDGIETPVVIQVANGQTSTQVQRPERLAGPARNVGQAAPRAPGQELEGHL